MEKLATSNYSNSTEELFRKYFKSAIINAEVGFIGGDDNGVGKDPSYKLVCTGLLETLYKVSLLIFL